MELLFLCLGRVLSFLLGLQVLQLVDVVLQVYGKFSLFLIEPCSAQRAMPKKRKVALAKRPGHVQCCSNMGTVNKEAKANPW